MEETQITKQHVVEDIYSYLDTTEATYNAIKKKSDKIYLRTTKIIKIVFFSIGLLLFFNVYFLYSFGDSIVAMASSMDEMYTHFGNMGNQVGKITDSVVTMSSHVSVLPDMDSSMYSMRNTVVDMSKNVQLMQSDIFSMTKDISSINNNIFDITYRFEQVNSNMNNIGNDVNDMSHIVPF